VLPILKHLESAKMGGILYPCLGYKCWHAAKLYNSLYSTAGLNSNITTADLLQMFNFKLPYTVKLNKIIKATINLSLKKKRSNTIKEVCCL
jgi:hypothetical protein